MNGNQLADILRWGGEEEGYQYEWYAHQRLPQEWWKKDFPYREALQMGYELEPEEAERVRRELEERRRPKDLSEQLANILKSPDFMMLDPKSRIEAIQLVQKMEAAKAEEKRKQLTEAREEVLAKQEAERAQELHELELRREKYAIAEGEVRLTKEVTPRARAVAPRAEPEELAAALRPAPRGVQFRMVGGELIKEPAKIWERERLTPEQKIAKRKAELEEAEYYRTLAVKKERPEMFVPLEERKFKVETERKKDEFNLELAKFGHTKETDAQTADLARDKFLLTIKEFGFEVAKEKSRSKEWWTEFGLKDKESQEAAILATKEFALEIEKFGLENTVAKHGMQMEAGKLKLDVRKQDFETEKWKEAEKQLKREFGEAVGKRKFDEKMRTLEFQEETKQAKNDYELEKITEAHAWKETLFNMGFKEKEFVELAEQFWGTLDFNKEKEEKRAKEWGIDLKWDKEQEANVMDRFEATLEREYKRLDLDVKIMGLNEETEARIAKMAMLQFGLDVKKLGVEEATLKWEKIAEKKEWWFKEEELKLKNTEAQRLFKDLMHRISQDAKEFGLKGAIHKENIRQFDEKMKVEHKKLEGTPEAKIEIGGRFATDLSGLGAELQDEVMGYIKGTYNVKTGKLFFPNTTQMASVGGFLFGREGERRSNEELGINLPADEFVKKVARQPMWPPELKGWCIRARYNKNVWEGMCDAGAAEGKYISPEEVAEPGLWEKITGWWPFGKEKKEVAEVDFPSTKIYVDMLYDRTGSMAEVERYLKEDVGITLDEYKEWLRGR